MTIKKTKKIEIGDVVEMKSGSPPMVVVGTNDVDNQVTAVWYRSQAGIGKIEQTRLPEIVLRHSKVKA